MRKKLFVSLIVLIILLTSILSGCNNSEAPKVIVFLGDSIAEGIAGISPMGERERYAYFGVLGIRNEYNYINRAVSGHKSEQMLDFISKKDYDARTTKTFLKTADIIQVSILGNDLLQNGLSEIIIGQASGGSSITDDILATSAENFDKIIVELRSGNPNATILIQTLYNPAFEDMKFATSEVVDKLREFGVDSDDYRRLGGDVVDRLNNIIKNYLVEHPDAFHIIDVNAEFERIYQEDNERGKSLIFYDDVHPSNEGHAVIADLTQAKLEELGLANKELAIKNYKELRKEQLVRLYSAAVDVSSVCQFIDEAKSCGEITQIYFQAVRDKVPVYY